MRLLERILVRNGHEVEAVGDGEVALRRYDALRPDLVISDWMMPGLDGPELIRRIRALEGGPYTFVLLLTSRSEREDLVAGLDAGADDFLRKPFDPGELVARVRAAERIIDLQASVAARNEELELANRRMKEDLIAAARIQQSFLPTEVPPAPGLECAWSFQPCDELAGDILNVFSLDARHVGFYLLDVSGHGVPAALLSVTLSRMLVPSATQSSLLVGRTVAAGKGRIQSPATVAERLNHRFAVGNLTGQHFTLLYGILDVERNAVRYVCAGHPGAVHVPTSGEPRLLGATGPPIGILDGLRYEEREVEFAPGDRLFVYSDGLTEARRGDGEQFGLERLVTRVASGREEPLDDVVARLVRDVRVWVGGRALQDDASCLALQVGHRT